MVLQMWMTQERHSEAGTERRFSFLMPKPGTEALRQFLFLVSTNVSNLSIAAQLLAALS